MRKRSSDATTRTKRAFTTANPTAGSTRRRRSARSSATPQSAISTAYPWLGCTGGPYAVWTHWGISDDVYCAGKETTFEFIEKVLTEVLALFPSKLIHIGGDECPKGRWKACPLCQQRIREEGLKDEYQL